MNDWTTFDTLMVIHIILLAAVTIIEMFGKG